MRINNLVLIILFLLFRLCYSQTPELVIQNGHSSGALLMDVSYDGRYLISSGADINSLIGEEFSDLPYDFFKKTDEQNGLIIYDLYSGKILRYCQNSRGGIHSIASSLIDYSFATGDYFGNISIFDLNGNVINFLSKTTGDFTPVCLVNYIRFFNKKNFLAAGYSDSTICIWDLSEKKIQKIFKLPSNVKLMEISYKDNFLIFGCENGYSGIISLTGENISFFDKNDGDIIAIRMTNDDKYVYSLKINSFQNEIQIWNVTGLKLENKFLIDSPIFTRGIFTADCKKLFASPWVGGLIEINCITGKIENENVSESKEFTYALSITPDSKVCIFSLPYAKKIQFYDLSSKKITKTIWNEFDWIISANFLSDSKSFISVAGKSIYWWDLAYCKIQNSLKFDDDIYSISCSQDSRLSALGTSNGNLVIVDNQNKSYNQYKFSESPIYAIEFSDISKKLAFASDKVYIFDLVNNELINSFRAGNKTIKTIKFISESDFIVVGGFDKETKIFNYKNGELVKILGELNGIVMSMDIDEKELISIYCAGKGIYIYNYKNFTLEKFIKYDNSLITCIKLIEDKMIASDWNGEIYLIDLKTGSYKKLFAAGATILKIDISPDKKFLITGGTDGCVKLWDLRENIELANFISVGSFDYLTIIPEKYYTVSKNGYRAIAFRIENRAYPFEQFDLIFNRPDLVYKKIGILTDEEIDIYKKVYEKRLKKTGFINFNRPENYSIPEISIINKNIKHISDSDIFNLEVSANDNKYYLKELFISVNNVPYKNIILDSNKSKLYKLETEIPVELSYGRNKITVSCFNEKGIESLNEVIEIFSLKEVKPDLYIISFGVSEYIDRSRNLNYASKDAKDFSNLFLSDEVKYRFKEVKVITLIDSQVTKENILEVKKILLNTKINDVVILFFAGHGLLDKDGNYYFGTYDINFDKPTQRGINYDEIESLLDGINARIKILFMDSCHSGDLDEDEYKSIKQIKDKLDTSDFRLVINSGVRGDEITEGSVNQERSKSLYEYMKELFNDISRTTGAIVISASSGISYALESSELKNGVFTYSIIKGLKNKEADLNKDGKIFISELKEYIIDNVSRLTNNGQKPTVRKENFEYDYQIW